MNTAELGLVGVGGVDGLGDVWNELGPVIPPGRWGQCPLPPMYIVIVEI